MTKLIVTADIHGQYSIWQKICTKLSPTDILIVAGDLFDTRYGNCNNSDFQPEKIKIEFQNISNTKYYVYGNCDESSYYPNHDVMMNFNLFDKRILLCHGHLQLPDLSNIDIVISGHSHIKHLQRKNGTIFLNPGSASFPRDGIPSYATIEQEKILIKHFNNNEIINRLSF